MRDECLTVETQEAEQNTKQEAKKTVKHKYKEVNGGEIDP